MRNLIIYISPQVEEKLLHKHGIGLDELKDALKNGNPKILKLEGKIYMATTHYLRYVTIIFEYSRPTANIITAYTSSKSQIRRYKRK